MYRLKLNSRQCISCGICVDVCLPRAMEAHLHVGPSVEGIVSTYRAYQQAGNTEHEPMLMMTFPRLAKRELCDGCMACVRECPTRALEIRSANIESTVAP